MKKRIVSLLLALALLVLPVLPAFAAEEDPYTYVALGDSITTGVGLKDTHFSSTAKSYDVPDPEGFLQDPAARPAPRFRLCRKTIIITPKTAMWPGWPMPWAWTGTMP